MAIQLYNSLTKKKEFFKPIKPNQIRFYLCGITTYDDCHIGHARTNAAFDVIVRYLRFSGFEVTFVRNITDIDDKIIQRAQENNENIGELVKRMITSMNEDFSRLHILAPDHAPRATEMISEMCLMIQTLIEKDYAYVAANGDVYYRIEKFKGYGKLSNQDLASLKQGARIEVTKEKENPLDFVLWKMAKPGEPSFDSPWGKGRPGWHIECSAMAKSTLGETLDIHGGGSDLRFPHHENEIAQSEAANSAPFANYWLHTGMVQVNDEKMSKSLNNFFSIKTVLTHYHPEVLRFFLISGHYRSEINYSDENLEHAKAAIDRLYMALRGLAPSTIMPEDAEAYLEKFIQAMDNDFNTPEAIAVLFSLAKEINKHRASGANNDAMKYANLLRKLAKILGLLQYNTEKYFIDDEQIDGQYSKNEIEALIAKRLSAKKQKDWATADQIRTQLLQQGIVLEDSATETLWRHR